MIRFSKWCITILHIRLFFSHPLLLVLLVFLANRQVVLMGLKSNYLGFKENNTKCFNKMTSAAIYLIIFQVVIQQTTKLKIKIHLAIDVTMCCIKLPFTFTDSFSVANFKLQHYQTYCAPANLLEQIVCYSCKKLVIAFLRSQGYLIEHFREPHHQFLFLPYLMFNIKCLFILYMVLWQQLPFRPSFIHTESLEIRIQN